MHQINQIDKYDKALLDRAKQFTIWRGKAPLTLDNIALLLQWALEQQPLTTVRLSTLKYIRAHFRLSNSAAAYFDLKLAMHLQVKDDDTYSIN